MLNSLTGGDLDTLHEIWAPKTRDWLIETVEGLVDDEGEVNVEFEATPTGTMFNLTVANKDLGKVIGKQGKMARSLRGLLYSRGKKHGTSFNLNIQQSNDARAPIDVPDYQAKMARAILR